MIAVILLSLFGVAAAQTCPNTITCSRLGPQVCGSDGQTYRNTCLLNIAICHAKMTGRYLRLLHSGACRSGTGIATNSANCDEICNTEEGVSVVKVCMSNGQTYESKCEANNAMCNATLHHEHLTVVHSGACLDLHSSCADIASHTGCYREAKHYMCASNGYTYQNECYLKEAQCRLASTAEPIDILHDGLCHDTSTNGSRNVDCSQYADMSLQGVAIEGQTVVIKHCTRTSILGGLASSSANHVCVDGRTYWDECLFCTSMAALHKISYQQMNIPISHDGTCKTTHIVG